MRYIPSWFPGASFKRTALLSQKYADDMMEAPFQFVEKSMASSLLPCLIIRTDCTLFKASGVTVPSMVTESLKRAAKDQAGDGYLQAVKESSVTAFAGEMLHPPWAFIFNQCRYLHQLPPKQYALFFQSLNAL